MGVTARAAGIAVWAKGCLGIGDWLGSGERSSYELHDCKELARSSGSTRVENHALELRSEAIAEGLKRIGGKVGGEAANNIANPTSKVPSGGRIR